MGVCRFRDSQFGLVKYIALGWTQRISWLLPLLPPLQLRCDFFRWCTVDLSTLSLGLPYAATIYGGEATNTIRRYPSIELYANENCLMLLTETAYRRK